MSITSLSYHYREPVDVAELENSGRNRKKADSIKFMAIVYVILYNYLYRRILDAALSATGAKMREYFFATVLVTSACHDHGQGFARYMNINTRATRTTLGCTAPLAGLPNCANINHTTVTNFALENTNKISRLILSHLVNSPLDRRLHIPMSLYLI